MKSLVTVTQMFAGNSIYAPSYGLGYTWETDFESSDPPKQVNNFLAKLMDFVTWSAKSKYYFGHFLFEDREHNKFEIIDGQQELTTIIILLSVLFKHLKGHRELNESEKELIEDIIKRNSKYRFSTDNLDNQLFKDYVIDPIEIDKNKIDTCASKRIVNAFDYFDQKLAKADEVFLLKMINTTVNSLCSAYTVTDEIGKIIRYREKFN